MNEIGLSLLPILAELPFSLINRVAIIVLNFSIGLLVVTVINHSSKTEKKGKLFLLLSVAVICWVDGGYLARAFGDIADFALPALRLSWLAAPIVAYLAYLICVHLLKKEDRLNFFSTVLFVLVALASIFAGLTNLVIESYNFTGGIIYVTEGIFYFPYLICVFASIISSIWVVIFYRKPLVNNTLMVGVVCFFLISTIFNIFLPNFLNIYSLYFVGHYSSTILLAVITFSILKDKKFDVRVFATEILTISIWVTLLVRIFLYNGTYAQTIIDLGIFLLTVFFGVLVIKSVKTDAAQRERLSILTNQLKDADAKKDEFINMAAHELRAPLTAIKGFISMVLNGDTGSISKQASEFLEDSAVSTERMIRLVNNMLNVTRIEEGRLIYQPELFRLSKTAEAVYKEFQVEAERKSLKFSLEIQPNVIDNVFVDEDKLHEVIVNFVSNAIKYTEEGFVKIKVSNTSPHIARLEVIDSGHGVSTDEQKKLFHKFYRIESRVGKTIGTGLGLYISKLLVEKFGGRIGVSSDSSNGSNFWFELPVSNKG